MELNRHYIVRKSSLYDISYKRKTHPISYKRYTYVFTFRVPISFWTFFDNSFLLGFHALTRHFLKWRASSCWWSSPFCFIRHSGSMTIRKTHPTLKSWKIVTKIWKIAWAYHDIIYIVMNWTEVSLLYESRMRRFHFIKRIQMHTTQDSKDVSFHSKKNFTSWNPK